MMYYTSYSWMWWRIVKNLTVPASPNAVPVKIFPATFADEAVVLP